MHGDLLISSYLKKLERHKSRAYNLLVDRYKTGRLNDNQFYWLKNLANNVSDNVWISPYELDFVMDFLGVVGYSKHDITSLMYLLCGRISVMSMRDAFQHHPNKYFVGKMVASYLSYSGKLEDKDRFRLGVGRSEELYDIVVDNHGSDLIVSVIDKSEYKVRELSTLEYMSYMRDWMASKVFNQILWTYPERGIIVTPI